MLFGTVPFCLDHLLLGLFVCCLVVWAGSLLARLVLIIADCGILVGRSVVMDLLLDLVRVLLCIFLDELLALFRYPSGSGRLCLLALFPYGTLLLGLPV